MSIAENILRFRESIPPHVTLVAVSKTKPVADLMEAYETGQRIFGENKIQEMTEKWEEMPKDIQWHMIGHVQTNKVKFMAPFVSLVHAVDRIKLLKEINKQALANDRVIDVLIQVKIAREDSKFGMAVDDVISLFQSKELDNYPNVNVVGLMGMATFTDDQRQVQAEFELLEGLFLRFRESANLTILSSGMSGDYKLAIDNGSTMIRVGSSIFGAR
ncbi:alanine racemase domain-containing protein [Dokdonia sp. MED134]|uniref:YggS family pyridoxal phosphate-dependent enzyme n=1 Tax=Dokdonia sp. MED134 TaxID=313590 RepID=UPI000068E431|nr:YggS family pyridoxal phosphate-dependent enzyme [Dokdonia sp. MED134]EAQ38764.1 alanine racemase domain-containing protein [Dokdonia sp. MED134]